MATMANQCWEAELMVEEQLLRERAENVRDNSADSVRETRLTEKQEGFLLTRPETPVLVMDVDVVEKKFVELREQFPLAEIFYAVKANPAREILELLYRQGANFDVASRAELDLCLSLGVRAIQLSYGNTIKKAVEIAYAYAQGVRLFTFDSEADVEKLAEYAPGARVMCRLLTSGKNAAWPLSRKFGCDLEMAQELLLQSHALGLQPTGIAFHVGSQQMDTNQWDWPIEQTAILFRELAKAGIVLDTVNVGGGFPVRYSEEIPPLAAYAEAIGLAMRNAFGKTQPKLMLEPGRSLVAEAEVIQAEVVLVSRKSKHDEVRWVYLDAGKFGGLAETLEESIQYEIRTPCKGESEPVVIAGPTCDSADILYEKAGYRLPLDLACGDRVEILNTGAYTSTYASVGFNGFGPLRTVCL